MITVISNEIIFELADRLLAEGTCPTAELISSLLKESDPDMVEAALRLWWGSLSGRVVVTSATASQVPDGLAQAVRTLWHDAVREATLVVNRERESVGESLELLCRDSEEAIVASRADYEVLEIRYRNEAMRSDTAEHQVKTLEAELSVLKSNITGEITQRKQAEERLDDARNEVKRANKALDDAKRTFDHRIKDEQGHSQEQLMKVEAELRHYRTNIERLRDESGKKEAALIKNHHDLQSEIARKDVKLETLQGQLKSLESELKVLRSDNVAHSRSIAQLNAKLLTETNRAKRHDERVKQLETDLRQEQQRVSQATSESLRKEADLRLTLKAKEEELSRVKSTIGGLQKKIVVQEEQIRRLSSQVRI